MFDPSLHKLGLPEQFLKSYERASIESGMDPHFLSNQIEQFIKLYKKEITTPSQFGFFHQALPEYREFGLNFMRPIVDLENSTIRGVDQLKEIEKKVEKKENVILLSNHQTEPDPQILGLVMEKSFKNLWERLIFVAGDRVVRDPLAVPLSLGCNLLCIYSKKYIETPPEQREEKIFHNKKTLSAMEELLKEGGQFIYVAPSGGRDRKEADGSLKPALFSPESVELLYLIGKKSGTKTHFHTLALRTYDLLPPPPLTKIDLGEERVFSRNSTHFHFGKELNFDSIPGGDKQKLRLLRAETAYQQLLDDYYPDP